MKNEEKYIEIMNHYGYEAQIEQFIEECAEAIQAAQKCKRHRSKENLDHFHEEVADVIIMGTQMYNFLDTEKIDRIIEQKLDRQIERIRKEG